MSQPVDIEDHAALLDYLRRTDRLPAGETPRFETLGGGVSNKTVLVMRPSDDWWVVKQALPKLRVKVDWFSDPSRIQQEAEALRWLPKVAPPEYFTPLLFEDPGQHLLVMRSLMKPHENFKKTLLEVKGLVQTCFNRFGKLLGLIHRGGYENRGKLAEVFDGRSFFESLRLEPYYAYAADQTPEVRPFLERLIDETRRTRQTLVHGDYSPKNILLTLPSLKLVLLDHEVIHWGDPAFDVGFALTHLLSKAHHRPGERKNLATGAKNFGRSYFKALGGVPFLQGLEPRAVRHTLACLLARVAGRSPLEYLTPAERERQRDASVGLMRDPPQSVAALVEQFLKQV